jgi:hypothetical protein
MPRNDSSKMKKNIITFEATSNHVFEVRDKPVPAVKIIPDWWKNISKYSSKNNKINLNPGPSVTVKQCAPTIDALSSGYVITLWADLLVTQNEFGPYIKCNELSEPPIDVWSERQLNNFEVPDGFSSVAFKYFHGWNIITPPGWSTLFIHPVGYQNLPIRAISGVVDTDILKTPVNCPFFVKENFEGVIEKGTPMVQIIPLKREVWESEFTNPGIEKSIIENDKVHSKIYGYYSSKRYKKEYK